MKLSEAMKREFEKMVSARVSELLLEQVEEVAQAQVKALVNGKGAHKKAAHPILYPPSTVLKRGSKDGLGHFRMTTLTGLMASAAWESLSRGESFSGRATRADMTAYLLKTFGEQGATVPKISAALSLCLKRGVLVPA